MNDTYDSSYFMGKFFQKLDELPISEESKITLMRIAGSINTYSYREGVISVVQNIKCGKSYTDQSDYI